VVVNADAPEIPVGIDGETVMMATPVRCTIQPRALRVRVPRDRPGDPAAQARPRLAHPAATSLIPPHPSPHLTHPSVTRHACLLSRADAQGRTPGRGPSDPQRATAAFTTWPFRR
jgi:hypothetical protein